MEFLVNPHGMQQRHENIRETANGLKAKSALRKCEGLDKDVVRREKNPLVFVDGQPGRNHIRVPGFITV